MSKVTVVGAGKYGSTTAQRIAEWDIVDEVVMTDIVTIGAGGGSLARVDSGGMLQVGPESAGADPGPACYGKGGDTFALTDAMLLLGLLDPAVPLPGNIVLDPGRAAASAWPAGRRRRGRRSPCPAPAADEPGPAASSRRCARRRGRWGGDPRTSGIGPS